MNWYIVQAYLDLKKVVDSIKDELKRHKLEEKLDQILVPTHQVTEVKKGKRTKREKNIFLICASKSRTNQADLPSNKKFTKSKWLFGLR